MKVWIHLNGVQEGPYEIENLPLHRMDANTPVWHEGLADWMPAGKAPATAYLVNVSSNTQPAAGPNQQPIAGQANNQWPSQQQYQYYQPQQSTSHNGQKCPPTFMVWSILLTVLCCNPVGIIPIATGMTTMNRFRSGNYPGARRMSNATEWWIMITIVISLFMLPLSLLMKAL